METIKLIPYFAATVVFIAIAAGSVYTFFKGIKNLEDYED